MSAELFVELRCEELPASMVRPALEGLAKGLLGLLQGIDHGEVSTFATPRRLAVAVADVAPARPTTSRTVTGPPADRAFKDGVPTKTAIGFARSKGVDVEALTIVEIPKRGAVVAATVEEGGESAVDLVSAGLADVIAAIPFKKSMIWGDGGLVFGRPLHGIVVVYDGVGIEGSAHGLPFGTTTLGHRLSKGEVEVRGSASWLDGLRARSVEPDLAMRAARIRGLLDRSAAELGADPITDDALAEEVLHLVEWPEAVIGAFDEELLTLPAKLLVTSMRVHQRYFPIHVDGALTNRFVVITNNPFADPDLVAEGNARVLRARFHDAKFFLAEDQQQRLEAHGEQLVKMRWIRGLGTMADKGERLAELGATAAAWLGADPQVVRRAAVLAKADLATQMVGEFPELQGHMGRLYAAHQGEDPGVAEAIEAHYLPRFRGDELPSTEAGAALALAERLDALIGCFGAGLKPKGGDPQGLRRAAGGLVRIVIDRGLRIGVDAMIAAGIAVFGAHAAADGRAERFDRWSADGIAGSLRDFVLARYRAARVADGVSPDVVDAVLAADGAGDDLVVLDHTLNALADVAADGDFPAILTTFKRVLNITGDDRVDWSPPEYWHAQVEIDLDRALHHEEDEVVSARDALELDRVFAAILRLRAPVEAFFDGVLVNAPEAEVRDLRLGLLWRVADLFRSVADFARISTR